MAFENKFAFWYSAGATRWPKNRHVQAPTKEPKVKAANCWLSSAILKLEKPLLKWNVTLIRVFEIAWYLVFITLSSQMIMRQPGFTVAKSDPIESNRHGGAFFGDIILWILPSKQIRGLRGSTIIAKKSLAKPVQEEPKVRLFPMYLITPFESQLCNCYNKCC